MVRLGFHRLRVISANVRAVSMREAAPDKRIARAMHPGIVMVAIEYPLIGEVAARDARDDVVERTRRVVHGRRSYAHSRAPGPI